VLGGAEVDSEEELLLEVEDPPVRSPRTLVPSAV
jgi:hypothetical protein